MPATLPTEHATSDESTEMPSNALGVKTPQRGPERQPKHIQHRYPDATDTSKMALVCDHKAESAEKPDKPLHLGPYKADSKEKADMQLDLSPNCSKKALVRKLKAEFEQKADKQLDVGLERSDNGFVQRLLCCPITKVCQPNHAQKSAATCCASIKTFSNS